MLYFGSHSIPDPLVMQGLRLHPAAPWDAPGQLSPSCSRAAGRDFTTLLDSLAVALFGKLALMV